MHLLSTQAAGLDDVEAAVDLGQTPADIVILSAADSELACLARAVAQERASLPSPRLANLLRLGHPLSVDLYLEQVVAHARLVVLRLLGGRGYWSYGLEQLAACCRERGILLACLPGDDRADPDLAACSTLPPDACARLWRYLSHGGLANARAALRFAATLLGTHLEHADPQPVPRAGLYHPDLPHPDLAAWLGRCRPGRPRALLVFYRALVQSGDLDPVDVLLHALDREGLDALGLHVASLKDREAAALAEAVIGQARPDIVLNATAFAVGDLDGTRSDDPLATADAPILQLVLSSGQEAAWRDSTRGLMPRDLAMAVALPEVDGRVLAGAVSFKTAGEPDPLTQASLVTHRAVPEQVRFTAALAAAWTRLRRTAPADRRIAVILANYPNRDGRLANGVGLDTPASCIEVLRALAAAGYGLADPPEDGDALMRTLAAGVTNAMGDRAGRLIRASLPLLDYEALFAALPEPVRAAVTSRWGAAHADPHLIDGAFPLAVLPLGNVLVGIQPARGYNLDPTATYHSPDLAPPHAYLAFYLWLRHRFGAHAVIHLGKHGNLEWLPGKAVALSAACLPQAILGPLPNLYPFIVNDPGEGTQAKRRTSAVILDHLTPPLTRAELYGELAELELLVDEYYEAMSLDPRRLDHLRREILMTGDRLGITQDLGLSRDDPADERLRQLDAHLCEIKELQIRGGLHVFGRSPEGTGLTDLLVALARVPQAHGDPAASSLLVALAKDLGLGPWNPLAPDLAAPWQGPRPRPLQPLTPSPWRTEADTLERLELLARFLVAGTSQCDSAWTATSAVLARIERELRPAVEACGPSELRHLLLALGGRRVPPGPSGAPTRGRPEVLPTGRNFFSVDTRAVPTPAAWALGWKSAALILDHHLQTEGAWPRHVALSAWGTANMRTGGDDIAQALALMGCRPTWDAQSKRVTGVEVLPLSVLGRPRVDVTLRVSGFFRDAFPAQLELLDDAVRAVARLDEPPDQNPLAAAARADTARLLAEGIAEPEARRRATARLFSSPPGAYGAGLQALIDERAWSTDQDFADAFLAWGSYAYGRAQDGTPAPADLRRRLSSVELVLHNQDNREHDLLDSDDYYQFEGGLAATVRHLSGRQPAIYHNDHSRPDHPRVRTLKEEIARVVRARATNPKWIRAMLAHGYKGAFELAATLDYLFAFAATARVVESHHFDALFEAYLGDEEVRAFVEEKNPAALTEMTGRLLEAMDRGFWQPRSNRTAELLQHLAKPGRERQPAPPS